jgi:alcohol dehydrogenase
MMGFDFHCRTRILFGADSVDGVGELARSFAAARVLLVTDAGLVAAGHADRVRARLESADIDVTRFDGTHENPTTADVDAAVAVARASKPDVLVALGGGSAIDTAKGCNFIHTNGGVMVDYRGSATDRIARPLLPLIAIPTTAGTGSEVQSHALIADAVTHEKMACGDSRATPAVAVLDPRLTLTCPRSVTIHAGIDALAHAVETAVTTRRHAMSLMFSHEAAVRILRALPRVLAEPDALDARADLLLGATLAGMAIESSMLGGAHASANPLTARFDVVHGHAVGIMLPHVMRFNAHDSDAHRGYDDLARRCGIDSIERAVCEVLAAAGLPLRLSELGVTRGDLPELAADAVKQWTGTFNPRPLSSATFVELYESAL